MTMRPSIPGLLDELIKIGVSTRASHFVQTRKNRRPIRASTLLNKESTNEVDDKTDSKPEEEVGRGFEEEGGDKVAAMAADLRRTGIGGVKRPAFATEESKQYALNAFNTTKRPGEFKTQTEPKHLTRPGPTIQQIAPKV